MRTAVAHALTLLLALPASAERLDELLFDMSAGQRFAGDMGRSVLLLSVRPRAPEWAVEREGEPVEAMGAAVADPAGFVRVITAGPVCEAAARIEVLVPGLPPVEARASVLGDGAVCELHLPAGAIARLAPLPLDGAAEIRVTRPVFSVGSPGTAFPVLVMGTVTEVFEEPIAGLFASDIFFPHGTPLLTPERKLLGLSFRASPADARVAIAVSAETLDAWLRPEGPPPPAGPAPDRPR